MVAAIVLPLHVRHPLDEPLKVLVREMRAHASQPLRESVDQLGGGVVGRSRVESPGMSSIDACILVLRHGVGAIG